MSEFVRFKKFSIHVTFSVVVQVSRLRLMLMRTSMSEFVHFVKFSIYVTFSIVIQVFVF